MSKAKEGEKQVETTRVQLELPERSYARLLSLKAQTESSSYSEVMKNALRLYEALVGQEELGREFYLKDKDGTMIKYQLFI